MIDQNIKKGCRVRKEGCRVRKGGCRVRKKGYRVRKAKSDLTYSDLWGSEKQKIY